MAGHPVAPDRYAHSWARALSQPVAGLGTVAALLASAMLATAVRPAAAAVVIKGSITVQDAANDQDPNQVNLNGVADPGETVQVSIPLHSEGPGAVRLTGVTGE